jgi:hypothetical protein
MRVFRGITALGAVAALSLALATGAGAVKYPNGPSGSIGPIAIAPAGVAVDESSGNVYVADVTSDGNFPFPKQGILRFDPGGTPLSPPSMGSGYFSGVAVQEGGAHTVYAFDSGFLGLFGPTSISAFDSSGAAAGSPFAVDVSGLAQIASDPAGNIYFPDQTTKTVQKYLPGGAAGTPASFQCAGTDCASGPLVEPNAAATDAAGHLYVADPGTLNERQEVAVDATGGTFSLSFKGQSSGATGTANLAEFDASGSGDLSEGSNEVTNLNTASGAFAAGQQVEAAGIPAGTTISEVIAGESKLILSAAVQAGATGTAVALKVRSRKVTGLNTSTGAFVLGEAIEGTGIAPGTRITGLPGGGVVELSAPTTASGTGVSLSAALPFDAEASVIQAALEALSTVGAGNASVSGGPTYTVEFTGSLAAADQPQMSADASGLSGGGASASVTTAQGGQPSRVVRFDADGSNGTVFATGSSESVAVDTAKGLVFVGGRSGVGFGYKVSVYDLAGNLLGSFGEGTISDDPSGAIRAQVAVNSTNGLVYVSQSDFQTPANSKVWIFAPIAEPTATTDPATNLSATGAKLNATVNPAEVETESCSFQYTDEADFIANEWANATAVPCVPNPGNASAPTAVSATIGALSPLSSYRYRVVEKTAGGTAQGAPVKFTTTSPAPKASTEAASGISQSAATLNGKVDAEGGEAECKFEYGTSTAYGKTAPCSITPVTGTNPTAVSAALTGLSAATTYHYRLVAGTVKGQDLSFATPPDSCASKASLCPPPPVLTPPVTTPPVTTPPPAKKPLTCKKGFKKKKVHGTFKCVKLKKKHHKKKH